MITKDKFSKLKVTGHVIDRFKERYFDKIINDNVIESIRYYINSGDETKRFLNDTYYLCKQYEKYGYDLKIRMIENDNMRFIILNGSVVTVY